MDAMIYIFGCGLFALMWMTVIGGTLSAIGNNRSHSPAFR